MIEFYLKNFKSPIGQNKIREMVKVTDAKGVAVVDTISDEGVQHQHPVEYAEFRALVDANQDEMYAAAIAESEKEGE